MHDLECFALGVLGWSEERIENACISTIYKAKEGRIKYDFELKRQDWEQTRLLGYWSLLPHIKNINPSKVITFDWDKKPAKTKKEWLEENKNLEPIWDKLKKAK